MSQTRFKVGDLVRVNTDNQKRIWSIVEIFPDQFVSIRQESRLVTVYRVAETNGKAYRFVADEDLKPNNN